MISLTGKAVEAVDRFINSMDKPFAGLRIQVEGGGCSGFKYTMSLEESQADSDQVIDCGSGVKLLVDESSASMLEGVTVDFVENLEGSGFKFENPNATGTCGCGNSFTC